MNDNKQKAIPIQRQLMRVMLLTSGVVLLLTCAAFFVYEYITFRQTNKSQLMTLAEIIAANSTAALAFDSPDDAQETLQALATNEQIVAACLYDRQGTVFATFPAGTAANQFPPKPHAEEFRFAEGYLEGFQPVVQGTTQLGLLYLKADMREMYDRFTRYCLIAVLVIGISFGLAYLLSRRLQRTISQPILTLAQTATLVSREHNYSVRAVKHQSDEVGLLTDAFNAMLAQIERQNTEIRSWNQQLEEKISERTKELEQTNAELRVVNDKLVKSNRDLEQFAYVASHDLQEPLRKIQMFAQLVETRLNDPVETQRYMGRISASAERMTALIKSVLNYSRLSNGKEPFTQVDLNEIVRQIQTDFELLIQEKKATLQLSPLPVVQGIPLQLHQLFANLISNSLKFSEKDPRIAIRCIRAEGRQLTFSQELTPTATYVEVQVQDNGIGFDSHYARKVFTIFQRLHTQKEYPGTGIGLALCKKIAENHAGTIAVKSAVGQGTTFFVYLPV